MTYAPVILGNKVSFKGPQMILLAIFYFLNSIEIRNFACSCPVHIRVVPAICKPCKDNEYLTMTPLTQLIYEIVTISGVRNILSREV